MLLTTLATSMVHSCACPTTKEPVLGLLVKGILSIQNNLSKNCPNVGLETHLGGGGIGGVCGCQAMGEVVGSGGGE